MATGDIDMEGQHNVETCAFLDKSGRRQGDRTGGFEKVSYIYSGSAACRGGPKFKFRGGRRQDGFQGGYKLCYRFLSGLCDRGVMCKFFHDKGAANFLRRRKRREAGSDRRGVAAEDIAAKRGAREYGSCKRGRGDCTFLSGSPLQGNGADSTQV